MSGLVGWIRIFEMASESLKPMWVHVLPASVDLYTPSPGWMLPRMHDSPVPMKTISGFVSETATAPTDELWIWPSVTGAHVSPPSVVFQSPPPVWPEYASFGRPFTPVAAIDRPARAGPMLRHWYAFRIAGSREAGAEGVCAVGAANTRTATEIAAKN